MLDLEQQVSTRFNIHHLVLSNSLSAVVGLLFSVGSILPAVLRYILALALLLLQSRSTLVDAADMEPKGWRINLIIRAMSFLGRSSFGLVGLGLMEALHLVVSERLITPWKGYC